MSETVNPAFVAARAAWEACSAMRSARRRNKRFVYGRQWDDPVRLPSGEWVTMAERARRNQCEPVTSNIIRQIVKSVVGRFRAEHCPEVPAPLKSVAEANQLDELDARTLEEFLISGCAIQRISGELRPGGSGPWIDVVSPARFFVNAFTDPRGHDIETIGMLHDWPFGELLVRLGAHADKGRADALRAIYDPEASRLPFALRDSGVGQGESFLSPDDYTRCRVIEVWTRRFSSVIACVDAETGRVALAPASAMEGLLRENARRRKKGLAEVELHRRLAVGWTGCWLSPSGRLLRQVERSDHPFVVKMYPLIDGEVHPFIEDVIDRQIQVNRTLTMVDRIMSVSAKEVLLLPCEAVVGGKDWRLPDYARQWATPGAVIPYKSTNGQAPSVVNTAGLNSGLSNLLAVELDMMEQVSGVGSALRGMRPGSATTAGLYNAQAENSALALHDIFDTFNSFRAQRNARLL